MGTLNGKRNGEIKPASPPPAQASNPARSGARPALNGLKFIAKKGRGETSWADVAANFDRLTTKTDGLLYSSKFGECLGMETQSYDFGKELFYAVARRFHIRGDSINKVQLNDFWNHIADDNFDTRLQIFFDMIDKDGDGEITREEVKEIIRLCANANQLPDVNQHADEYADLVMEELDPCEIGRIQIEDLEILMLEDQKQVVAVRERPKKEESKEESGLGKGWYPRVKSVVIDNWRRVVLWYRRIESFIIDNKERVRVMMVWLAACFTLFIYKFVEYKNKDDLFAAMGYCVCVAKGGAETLKLNMALILLPVCRNTITWLRNKTMLGAVVPFDDNLNFHQVIAVGVMVGVVLHAGAHLTCDFPRILMASDQRYEESLAKYLGEDRPASYWWFIKGWEGVTGILMIVLMVVAMTLATPWLRTDKFQKMLDKLPKKLNELTGLKTKTGLKISTGIRIVTGFNVFWYSHHLFVIVYALLIVHGIKLYFTTDMSQKTTWMYIVVPVALYAIERLIRVFRSTVKPVSIHHAVNHRGDLSLTETGKGDLLALIMSKPPGFDYKSGQYMFVKCPAVSPFEWHPFSITSSPGDDYLGVHIRALGDWTWKINNVFLQANRSAGGNNPEYPKISIDGPYGAPAQEYKKYDVVLLIGLGIGATPMISIVKDIINNMRTIEDQALETGKSPGATKEKEVFKTQKAYFYWVTPQQGTFKWFQGIMNEVKEIDGGKVIEVNNYCSSVYKEDDVRSDLIAKLQNLHYAKRGVDLLSGTRDKTHFAKPDWRQVYKRIAANHPGTTIGVFYCGAPVAVKQLKDLALKCSTKTTKFEFHKENF